MPIKDSEDATNCSGNEDPRNASGAEEEAELIVMGLNAILEIEERFFNYCRFNSY